MAVDCKQKVYIESYMLLPQEYANCHGNGNNDKKHQMSGKVYFAAKWQHNKLNWNTGTNSLETYLSW